MSKLLFLAAAVVLSPAFHSQTSGYVKGDVVRLVAPTTGAPFPDSRVIAVAGDRIQIDRKSGIFVNGKPVQDVSRQFLDQFAEPWDLIVPVGHYFVMAERRESPTSVVKYHGLIPAEKIVRKVSR